MYSANVFMLKEKKKLVKQIQVFIHKNTYLFKTSLIKFQNKNINYLYICRSFIFNKNKDITQSKTKIQNRIAIVSEEFIITPRSTFLKIIIIKAT